MNRRNDETSGCPRIPVADLRPGERVQTVLLAIEKRAQLTRTGNPYLALVLGDRTGTVNARVWEGSRKYEDRFEAGDFLLVDAFTETYRGQTQLKVNHLERVDPESVDVAEFQAASKYDRPEMLDHLRQMVIRDIDHANLRTLLLAIFEDNTVIEGLLRAPAAKIYHHAYIGGLLEHTVSMCRLARQIGRHYQEQYPGLLDTGFLIAGSILHDIGKIWEFSSDRQIEITDAGRLLGHISMAVELVTRTMERLDMDDELLSLRLKHMILSHHGELEYGAVVMPQTPEAQILHYIDQIDARLNMFAQAIDKSEGAWSEYNRPLGRFIYAGPLPGSLEGVQEPPNEAEGNSEAPANVTLDLFAPSKTE